VDLYLNKIIPEPPFPPLPSGEALNCEPPPPPPLLAIASKPFPPAPPPLFVEPLPPPPKPPLFENIPFVIVEFIALSLPPPPPPAKYMFPSLISTFPYLSFPFNPTIFPKFIAFASKIPFPHHELLKLL